MILKSPTEAALNKLQTFEEPGCLTVYLPWTESNAATNPMRIMLKDLAKEAEAALKAEGITVETIEQTLQPLRRLIDEVDVFWPHQHSGMALFLHPKLYRSYRLPPETAGPCVQVGRGFELQPLIDALSANQHYALLVLDRQATQLYYGDRDQLTPVHLKGFPADMLRTLNIDEFPSWRELHVIAPAYEGKRSAGYHSQYDVANVNKQMLLEFFRVIDHRLRPFLAKHRVPLVIAGVGYVLPLYRKANTYSQLSEQELHGNFRRSTLDALRHRTWEALHRLAAQPA